MQSWGLGFHVAFFGTVPIQDHTLHNIQEFTNFSTSHVIPDIWEDIV